MPRKSKASLKRPTAARKGWRTRRRRKAKGKPRRSNGVEIQAGYSGRDNSFSLRVIINTHRPIEQYSDSQLADLVETLAQKGHFDDFPANRTTDLSWVFFNKWEVTRRDVRIAKGHARLTGFTRTAPKGR